MKPKISVIIPIYNMGEYLPACLDSTLHQTLREIEILCINDGSTDNTSDILHEYATKDTRIRVISRENWGVGRTRNQGIAIAVGEFICFMDPDDYYPSDDILESMYKGAVEHDVLICGGEFSRFTAEDPTLNQNYGGVNKGYLFDKEGIVEYKDYQFDYGYHRFVYKRQWLIDNNIIFPPYSRYQDPPFFVKAMVLAGRFYALDKIVYAYRVSHKVIQWNAAKVNDMLLGMLDLMNYSNEYSLSTLRYINIQRVSYVYHIVKEYADMIAWKTFINICRSYVQFSQKDWLYSSKKLWNGNVRLVTVFGRSRIWEKRER